MEMDICTRSTCEEFADRKPSPLEVLEAQGTLARLAFHNYVAALGDKVLSEYETAALAHLKEAAVQAEFRAYDMRLTRLGEILSKTDAFGGSQTEGK
jgi:hypothetical protein